MTSARAVVKRKAVQSARRRVMGLTETYAVTADAPAKPLPIEPLPDPVVPEQQPVLSIEETPTLQAAGIDFMIRERLIVNRQIKSLERTRKSYDDSIRKALEDAGIGGLMIAPKQGVKLPWREGRTSVSVERLLLGQVDPRLIQACTVKGEPYRALVYVDGDESDPSPEAA